MKYFEVIKHSLPVKSIPDVGNTAPWYIMLKDWLHNNRYDIALICMFLVVIALNVFYILKMKNKK